MFSLSQMTSMNIITLDKNYSGQFFLSTGQLNAMFPFFLKHNQATGGGVKLDCFSFQSKTLVEVRVLISTVFFCEYGFMKKYFAGLINVVQIYVMAICCFLQQ